jgi:hypothetical protein
MIAFRALHDKSGCAEGQNSDTLKKAELDILSEEQCKEWFREAGHDGPANAIGEYHLCAGYKTGGFDSCQVTMTLSDLTDSFVVCSLRSILAANNLKSNLFLLRKQY